MSEKAGRRKTDGPVAYGLAGEVRHLRTFPGRGLVRDAALAHHVITQGTVPDQPADIDRHVQSVHGIQVFAIAFPVPGQSIENRVFGNIFHGFHHSGQQLAITGTTRRKGHTAVAKQSRRDPVPADRSHHRIPSDLSVQMGMQVDEAGSHDMSCGVDLSIALSADLTDRRDRSRIDCDICSIRRAASTIHHEAISND